MNKKLYTLLLFVLCCLTMSAQKISVASFKLKENDLTANTYGTMERDQNGEVAALIKVITTEQGFVFKGGMVGIVKTKQDVGEVWVYVPHGIKRIDIHHPQLGVLKDYYFPIPIEKAKTYEMELTTGRVETVVTHTVNKQYIFFNVKPVNATVELGDEILTVDEDGCAAKSVPFGTYTYRVSYANYHTEAGQVVVTPDEKAEVNVALQPNFGWVKMDAVANEYRGAYVYIDNERVGQLPFTSKELKSGTHKVKVVKNMYKAYETQVKISDNEVTALNVELVPNFANVTLVSDVDGEIWIDGVKKGKGRWVGQLEPGDYTVEVRKPAHRNASEIVTIRGIEAKTIQLKSPSPIYASLELESTPLRATVYIDGVKKGETPLILTDVLVGKHRVVFQKDGYGSTEKVVDVLEGVENVVSGELSNSQELSIVSYPSGASVYVDGVYKGVTPLKTTLTYGEHTVRYTLSNYSVESKTVDVDKQTTAISQTLSLEGQKVKITSNQSGASVSVDGAYKGVTPLTVNLGKGRHLISLSKVGYKSNSVYYYVPGKGDVFLKLESLKKWKVLCGVETGYSAYGLNYGLEVGAAFKRLALTFGVKNHVMGSYEYVTTEEMGFRLPTTQEETIQFMRFSTKLGYTFGDNWKFTPQIGLVYGPSFFSGGDYVKGNVGSYEEYQKGVLREKGYLLANADYSDMNNDIARFVRTRCGFVLGVRFELLPNSDYFGLYVAPEYVVGRELGINAGMVVKF